MSNPDPHPTETICVETAHAGAWAFELIDPRNVPLGGLRAMDVRRTLPQRKRSLIGGWCFLDHYGPDDVSITGGMNVPAHPHTGLQTASWLFSGEIEHRDSAGFHAMVRPGELNLMTGGAGISHSERSTADTTVLHGAQLWIALPEHARNTPKGFEHYVPPVLSGTGWEAQVFLGSLLGETSPVTTHSPIVGAEIRLSAGSAIDLALNPAFEHGLLVDSGNITMTRTDAATRAHGATTHVPTATLAFAPVGARSVQIAAAPGADARLLWIGGEPFGEQVIMWWNFIGRTHEEIAQARADWQAELSRVGVVEPAPHSGGTGQPINVVAAVDPRRFGLPEHEPDPPLPAPPLPVARLLPRDIDSGEVIAVRHDTAKSRFVVTVNGVEAGFTQYRNARGGNVVAFVHTEIDPAFGGRGLGGTLVRAALEHTRDLGRTIVPYCPFIASWLRKHPEFDGAVQWPDASAPTT